MSPSRHPSSSKEHHTTFIFPDCGRYVECIDHLAVTKECPAASNWNQTRQSCEKHAASDSCNSSVTGDSRRSDYVLARNDVCDYHLCKNGAGCLPISSYGYRCLCQPGFQGPYCDRYTPGDVCSNHNCRNGATCIPHIYFYKCVCPSSLFTGAYCETKLHGGGTFPPVDEKNPCRKNLCKNGAKCIPVSFDQYMCDCLMGYQPPYCEFKPCYFCNMYNTKSCDGAGKVCTCKKGESKRERKGYKRWLNLPFSSSVARPSFQGGRAQHVIRISTSA